MAPGDFLTPGNWEIVVMAYHFFPPPDLLAFQSPLAPGVGAIWNFLAHCLASMPQILAFGAISFHKNLAPGDWPFGPLTFPVFPAPDVTAFQSLLVRNQAAVPGCEVPPPGICA